MAMQELLFGTRGAQDASIRAKQPIAAAKDFLPI
jgi:hypothetical protein